MAESEAGAAVYGTVIVGARRTVAHPPALVFALLSDLDRHWPLLGGDLVEGGMLGGNEDSAELILRGPLPGFERCVRTRVTHSTPDTAFGGVAVAGSTEATIDWRLAPASGGATEVALDVGITPGGLRDRLLVATARVWLERRCRRVLIRLADELGAGR